MRPARRVTYLFIYIYIGLTPPPHGLHQQRLVLIAVEAAAAPITTELEHHRNFLRSLLDGSSQRPGAQARINPSSHHGGSHRATRGQGEATVKLQAPPRQHAAFRKQGSLPQVQQEPPTPPTRCVVYVYTDVYMYESIDVHVKLIIHLSI